MKKLFRGKFITVEGIEGAGKSTAMHFIQDYLTKANKQFLATREPGGTELAEKIRHLLLHTNYNEQVQPETELLLMFAGRAQHLSQVILPALLKGEWVVSDRFIDASYAYQAGGRGLAKKYIAALDEFIVDDVYPDLTLLLDVAPEIGFQRATKRSAKDRIEQEQMDFFVRVRNEYLERAKNDKARIKIIQADLPLPDVQQQIKNSLDNFLREKS